MSYETIIRAKLKVEMWRKSYGEKDKALSWAREEKDYEKLITSEQVEKYNNSQSAKLATDMFEKLKSVHWQYEEMLTALLTKWPHIINDYPTDRDARVRFPILFS